MGGLNTQRHGEFLIHSYTDLDDGSHMSWLAVVVVWRQRDGAAPRTWRGRLRRLRYRMGIDVLNARVHIGRDALFWHGSAGPRGEQETLFHDVRRVVRVLDAEIPMPGPGHTLYLFLDEAPDDGGPPSMLMRSETGELRLEPRRVGAVVRFSAASPFESGQPIHVMAGRDPEVRAFLRLA